jgi:hypothetical protein
MLIVMLGSNNLLRVGGGSRSSWTRDSFGDLALDKRITAKGRYNIWQPRHFQQEDHRLSITELTPGVFRDSHDEHVGGCPPRRIPQIQ